MGQRNSLLVSALKAIARRGSSAPDEPRPRGSSLPFISGDTFRSVAEIVLEKGLTIHRSVLGTGVIFADAETARAPSFRRELERARKKLTSGTTPTLVIHNGDTIPSGERLSQLTELVDRVFCVNAVDGIPGVRPIPIGLENVALKHNGKLHYYLDELDHPTPISQRTRMVLSSFHVDTNPGERERARDILASSRHGHEEGFRKSLDYRLEVRKTKFIISPPGNGIDCHRTWEAIYLGAVPVVKKGALAASLVDNLPVLAVNDYQEFVAQSDEALDQMYVELKSRPMTVALGHFWLSLITATTNKS